MVEQRTENPRVVGSIPTGGTNFCADLAHLVERHLAKVEVASSSLVIRSKGTLKGLLSVLILKTNTAPWPSGKAGACKALIPSSILGGASKNPECVSVWDFTFSLFTFHSSLNSEDRRRQRRQGKTGDGSEKTGDGSVSCGLIMTELVVEADGLGEPLIQLDTVCMAECRYLCTIQMVIILTHIMFLVLDDIC